MPEHEIDDEELRKSSPHVLEGTDSWALIF